jgi:UDP-N-acetylglucosamine 2-epimerase (non-hydrolysing)
MPEEVNRVLTDQISDLLFVTEKSAIANLAREGIAAERVHFVGNVMIDTLRRNLEKAVPAVETLAGRFAGGHALATLHRPSNVDDPAVLAPLLRALDTIARDVPIVFPLHPRTKDRIAAAGLSSILEAPGILALPPLGYLELLGVMRSARFVITDSGGIQEETTALGVPCFTVRENTERPITIDQGTNTLIGTDPAALLVAVAELRAGKGKAGRIPELWDGRAAERIAEILDRVL